MTLTPPAPSVVFDAGVIRFLVAHYPDNADGTPPDVWDLTLYSAECAKTRAAELLEDAGYTGVSTITQVVSIYAFPQGV